MIVITEIVKHNGGRAKAEPYNKTVPDMQALELLRTLNKEHHKCKHIDFVYGIRK